MKKFLKVLPSFAALSVLFGIPALAAEPTTPAPYHKAPPPPPACNWCGFYIGLNAGYAASADSTIINSGTDTGIHDLGAALTAGVLPSAVGLRNDGFIGGGQAGYNWQAGNAVVLGLEADFDGSTSSSSKTVLFPGNAIAFPVSTTYHRDLNWLSTVRGRLGFSPWRSILLYATGGIAVGRVKVGNSFTCPTCLFPTFLTSSTSAIAVGWAGSGGIEWMVTPHLSLKAEYLYADLGYHTSTITYVDTFFAPPEVSTLTSRSHDNYNIVRAGFDYHFAARY